MNSLNAISPIDGRYRNKVDELASYFSEGALIRYRVRVEIEYFIALGDLPQLPVAELFQRQPGMAEQLRDIYRHFTEQDALEVKEIEKTTNHDVKAVEYFIKRRFDTLGLEPYKEFIHFGLTSQDINNTSVPLLLKECHEQVLLPRYQTVFAYRMRRQMDYFGQIPFNAKFGGATGNFNAHLAAYPEVDWRSFGNAFVAEHLGLERLQYTTQIENYDNLAAYFDNCKRINVILIDLCRDIWSYISMEYFKQKIKAGEVGSSAMPHKVNPIDFENAEGNLGLANAIFEHLSHKLPISRLQRDLTDSTVSRNIGVPVAHTLISLASLQKGLDKLLLNEEAIARDLENNWAVVAEAVQTILRSVGYPNPYEALKQLTRTNQKVTAQTIADFVETLDVDASVKERIRSITPHNYLGYKLFND